MNEGKTVEIKVYANYGMLAHEKQIVFTANPADKATVREEIMIEIPKEFTVSENMAGEYLIDTPDGLTLPLNNILSSWGDEPAFMWYDGRTHHRVTLKWKEI